MGANRKMAEYKICFAVVLERLVHGDPASLNDLVALTGYNKYTLTNYIRVLKARKLVYVSEYRRRGLNNHWVEHYSFTITKHNDVPKPRYDTPLERARRYRAKKKLAKQILTEDENHA